MHAENFACGSNCCGYFWIIEIIDFQRNKIIEMKIKNILFSQPQPVDLDKSPYKNMITKYGVHLTFEKFIKIEGVTANEFRLDKVYLQEYGAIIFTSRNAIDHLFRIAKEMRYEMPDSMKYYCNSEFTAAYIQKYVQYRKRKVFHGKQTLDEIMDVIAKNKDDKFLFPCSDVQGQGITNILDENNVNYKRVTIYNTVSSDITHLDLKKFDMIVLFTPAGVKSLFDNYPDFEQGDIIFGGFGENTIQAMKEANLRVDIVAPTDKNPSMTMAIEEFLKNNK